MTTRQSELFRQNASALYALAKAEENIETQVGLIRQAMARIDLAEDEERFAVRRLNS
jgi:hypothetical protein